jgi:hypothetical protein
MRPKLIRSESLLPVRPRRPLALAVLLVQLKVPPESQHPDAPGLTRLLEDLLRESSSDKISDFVRNNLPWAFLYV